MSLPAKKFREHMRHLSSASITVLSLVETAGRIRDRRPLPKKSVVITFDDGYQNFRSEAWPVLKEFGFCATVFIVTGKMGMTNSWDEGRSDIPSLPLLSWDEAAALSSAGVDFGAHTANHADLSRAAPGEIEAEMVGAKKAVRERLGMEPVTFAYPYGRFTDEAVEAARRNFLAACTTKRGLASDTSDVHLLPRVETRHFADNDRFSIVGTPLLMPFLNALKIKRLVLGGK